MRGGTDLDRYSPLNVGRRWLAWCVGLILAMTVGWTAVIAWVEVSSGRHDNLLDTAIAVGSKAGMGAPLIPLYSILIVTLADLTGGAYMVTKQFLTEKWLDPWRERQAAERRRQDAELRETAMAEGREEGREAALSEVRQWNSRRLDAQSKGEPFDEPPPGI